MPSEWAAEPICTDHPGPYTPIADHRSPAEFSSPIQLVPTEVLTEILSYLGPGHLGDDMQDIRHECARAAIIPPTHVCQRWRQIALYTPSLWNRITVNLTQRDSTNAVECVESWLARGGDCPLFVKVQCQGQDVEYQRGWDALVETVIGHSCRWQEAAFSAPLLSTSFAGIRNRLPLLQTLRLALGRAVNPRNAFEAAPMLWSVVDLNSHSQQNLRRLPWTQLTNFTTDVCSFTEALSMLRMMPRIVRFSAELRSFLRVSMAPLRLSHLRNLALSYSGIGIDCLFDSLELPSLAKISLSERPGARTTWSTSLISLIHRSSCYDIATLDLTLSRYSGTEPQILDELIRVTTQLRTLDVRNAIHAFSSHRGSRDHSRLVQALTVSPTCGTSSHSAPELQTLLLDYWDDFQVQLFVDMVESRWRVDPSPKGGPVKRINSISLRRVPDAAIFDAVAMARMREFVAEGLTIRLEVVAGEYYYGYKLIPFDE